VEPRPPQILLDVDPVATAVERGLVAGWAPLPELPESARVWSIGHQSIVYFNLPEPAPAQLELRCAPFRYPGAPDLTLQVRLNGEPMGELGLRDGFHDYELDVPKSALRHGGNWLEFDYSAAAVPAEVLANSEDRRELAVGFRRVALQQESSVTPVEVRLDPALEPTPGWMQTQRGSFSQLLALPPDARLEFLRLVTGGASWKEPVSARVEIDIDTGSRIVWTERTVSRSMSDPITIDLSEFAGQAVRLRFVADDLPEGSSRLWLNPRIRSPQAEASARTRSVLPDGNLVLIVLDAAARDRLGVYGYPGKTTPELDALARESLVFDTAHSQAAYTLASTASLFTSLLPAGHGVVKKSQKLDPRLMTLAGVLRKAGFATGAFSANGFASPTFGMDNGFERFETVGRGAGPESVAGPKAVELRFERWLDKLAAQEATAPRRFFAYLHFIQPHEPYDLAPAEYYHGLDAGYVGPVDGSAEFMRRIMRHELVPSEEDVERLVRLYDGNLRYVDAAVGRVIEKLRGQGLLDRTLLIVTADHGEATGEHGFFGHNYSMQEEVTAIPLLIRLPGKAGRSGRVSRPAASIDVAPTALAALGVAEPDAFQGVDLLAPPTEETSAPPRVVYSRSAHDRSSSALWFGNFKYVDDPGRAGRTLTRGPDLDGDSNLVAHHPITYAFLDRSRIAIENTASATKPGRADISLETRAALEALGYVLE
jgi:arylsulfatase